MAPLRIRSLNGVIVVLMLVLVVPPIIGGGSGVLRNQRTLVAARDGIARQRADVSGLLAVSVQLGHYRTALEAARARPRAATASGLDRSAAGVSRAFADLRTVAIPARSRSSLDASRVLAAQAGAMSSPSAAARAVATAQQRVLDVAQRRNAEANAGVAALARSSRADTIAFLLGAGLSIVVAFGVAFWLSRSLRRPLRRLLGAAQRIGRGDLSDPIPTNGLSDFSPIAAAFNTMAGELRRDRTTLTQLAYHDALTGLANRGRFLLAIDERLVTAPPAHVLFIDIDDFKGINDTFGHAAGDAVLVETATRLRALGDEHLVARLGGDEFAVLIGGAHDGTAADLVARRLQRVLAAPFSWAGPDLQVTASIGLASSDAGCATSALLEQADLAMYAAKQAGKNRYRTHSEASAA